MTSIQRGPKRSQGVLLCSLTSTKFQTSTIGYYNTVMIADTSPMRCRGRSSVISFE